MCSHQAIRLISSSSCLRMALPFLNWRAKCRLRDQHLVTGERGPCGNVSYLYQSPSHWPSRSPHNQQASAEPGNSICPPVSWEEIILRPTTNLQKSCFRRALLFTKPTLP